MIGQLYNTPLGFKAITQNQTNQKAKKLIDCSQPYYVDSLDKVIDLQNAANQLNNTEYYKKASNILNVVSKNMTRDHKTRKTAAVAGTNMEKHRLNIYLENQYNRVNQIMETNSDPKGNGNHYTDHINELNSIRLKVKNLADTMEGFEK